MSSDIFGYGVMAAGAGAGIVAGFWSKLRSLLERICSLIFVTIRIQGGEDMRNCIVEYCCEKYPKIAFGARIYDAVFMRVKSAGRQRYVFFERLGHGNIFWRGILPIFINERTTELDKPEGAERNSISFFRGTLNPDTFMAAIMTRMNQVIDEQESVRGNKRFQIIRYHGDGPRKFGNTDQARGAQPVSKAEAVTQRGVFHHMSRRYLKWDRNDFGEDTETKQYVFSDTVEAYINEIGQWVQGEKWYKERGIPWRRGWLLQGHPGTGKTTLVKAAAIRHDLPVCMFDLPSMSNQDLLRSWQLALGTAPCIALFEDLDATFQGRNNILGENGGGLTFDCLLNCMSGIESADGIFVIVTTNHMEHLDPALGILNEHGESTRPGRLDRILELGDFDSECRMRMARLILLDFPQHEIRRMVDEGDKDTVVQFQNRCTQRALKQYWGKERFLLPEPTLLRSKPLVTVKRLHTNGVHHENGNRPALK